MGKAIDKLINSYFKKTVITINADKFYEGLNAINAKRKEELTEIEIKSLFDSILNSIEFFKTRLSLGGFSLSNLFDYVYKATYDEGRCAYGSSNRKKITRDLYVFLTKDETVLSTIPHEEHVKDSYTKKQLDELIGIQGIKEEVEGLSKLAKTRKKKLEYGVPVTPNTLHMVFLGNPGTGKTTVARLIGAIYKDFGLIENGHLIEVAREDIVSAYIGQTAKTMKELFKRAKGGVLFIDEAYALNYSDSQRDFGNEAINALVKLMEDYREDTVVILAGYPDKMNDFLKSNPGLRSRFSSFMYFEDYDLPELISIFCKMVSDNEYILPEGSRFKVEIVLEDLKNSTGLTGNARDVRSLFERTMINQDKRLFSLNETNETKLRMMLRTIEPEDIPEKISK